MDDFDAEWQPEHNKLHNQWFRPEVAVKQNLLYALEQCQRYHDEMPPIDQDLYDWLYGRPQEPERDPEDLKKAEDLQRAFARTQG